MRSFNPRRLDEAVESRWPWFFTWTGYRYTTLQSLYLILGFLIAALVLLLVGEPYSAGAWPLFVAAIGTVIRSIFQERAEHVRRM
jgi:hypothetical protein